MNTSNDATDELKPLPVLKVVRDEYCSQEMTDSCISYLQKNREDLLLAMQEGEMHRAPDFFRVPLKIMENLQEAGISVPQDHVGWIDLLFELSRRIRAAYDMPEIKVEGRPLVDNLSQTFPPLPQLKITEKAKQYITQEMADRILEIGYKNNPRLWFHTAEEWRHKMLIGAGLSGSLCEILKEEFPDFATFPKIMHTAEDRKGMLATFSLGEEASRRLGAFCNFERKYYYYGEAV